MNVPQLPIDVRVPLQLPTGPAKSHSFNVQLSAPMYSDAIQMLLPSTTAVP
jgi:hypothetical protein